MEETSGGPRLRGQRLSASTVGGKESGGGRQGRDKEREGRDRERYRQIQVVTVIVDCHLIV